MQYFNDIPNERNNKNIFLYIASQMKKNKTLQTQSISIHVILESRSLKRQFCETLCFYTEVTVLWGLSHMQAEMNKKLSTNQKKRSSSWVWLRYIYPLIKRDNSYVGFCLLSFQKGQFCQFFLYNISVLCISVIIRGFFHKKKVNL